MTTNTKLVRDEIPAIITRSGDTCTTHIATEDEYRALLYAKLSEEVAEVTEEPSREELADLLEVIYAICNLENWTLDEVEKTRLAKRAERGGFQNRVVLERPA
jgi:predicted house-cleaning noncanonical NTP pyrophosphatase (MazG superfamily)